MPFANDPVTANTIWQYVQSIMGQSPLGPSGEVLPGNNATGTSGTGTVTNPWPGVTNPGATSGVPAASPGTSGAAVGGVSGFIGPGGGVYPQTSPLPGGGVSAPFGSSASDGPPMWLAKNALAAYQRGDTKYRDHLLADPTIAGDPHLHNFIVGLFAGDPDRIKEANYYSTNPSYNGWNDAAGNGIPGDGL